MGVNPTGLIKDFTEAGGHLPQLEGISAKIWADCSPDRICKTLKRSISRRLFFRVRVSTQAKLLVLFIFVVCACLVASIDWYVFFCPGCLRKGDINVYFVSGHVSGFFDLYLHSDFLCVYLF